MYKNVAGQFVDLYAEDAVTGAPILGDAANITVYGKVDAGAVAALGTPTPVEVSATHLPGVYRAALTQAESNGNSLLFGGVSTTGDVVVYPVQFSTLPAFFADLDIDAEGRLVLAPDGVDAVPIENINLRQAIAGLFVYESGTTAGAGSNAIEITGSTCSWLLTFDAQGNRTGGTFDQPD